MDTALHARLHVAENLARDAGRLLGEYAVKQARGDNLAIDTKTSLTDPVSDADRASEQLIVAGLRSAFPHDGIVAEENGEAVAGTSGYRWVIDPLDGTVNFLHGIPQWCVSIACLDADGPVVGVVYTFAADELFTAVRGHGARLNDAGLSITENRPLRDCLIATGFSYEVAVRDVQAKELAELLAHVRDVRRSGAAALDLCFVAAGRVAAYFEMSLQPWDWAAGMLIVTEAKGTVRSFLRHTEGKERQLVIAGPEEVVDVLCEFQRRHAPLRPVTLGEVLDAISREPAA